jgi:hypothetical protein
VVVEGGADNAEVVAVLLEASRGEMDADVASARAEEARKRLLAFMFEDCALGLCMPRGQE